MNLLNETMNDLDVHGKFAHDVCFVMCDDIFMSFEDFKEWAKDIEYYDGYGECQISLKLKIVGLDWWLERTEYNGSEWWAFKQLPKKPKTYGKIVLVAP